MSNAAKELFDRLNRGLDEYHADVEAMTDAELWDHCFSDGGIHVEDFCIQELKKRFLYGNFEDAEKANQYLLDEGYKQEEIDGMTKRIADKVKDTINHLTPAPDKADKIE